MSGACLDENLLAAFLSGEIQEDERAAVELHVDACPDCRALLAALAEVASISQHAGAAGELLSPHTDLVNDALLRGTQVGRYSIVSLVGVGAMGAVYAADDPDLHRTVALKLVRARRGGDPVENRERLLREARTMAKLAHPNVVAVHDVGTFGERVFVAMDLVDGETLRSWLERRPTPRAVIETFLAAGRGLAAAHAAKVVHRDFKPENVLVGRDGRVLVTDFGLARGPAMVEEQSGMVAGTPAYMAPEQLRGDEVDPRADQFSFCVALHEALTGKRPFQGRGAAELLAAIDAQAFEDARTAPAHVRRALRRGLARTPDARFPSMDSLLAELSRDPAAKARWIALAGAATIALVAVAAVTVSAVRRERASCREGVPAKLEAVWGPAQRAAVHDAFLATKLPSAQDAWERASRGLDDAARRWTDMHVEACDATYVRADQSAELLDLRVACLGDHLGEMRSLVDVLSQADADTVKHASQAVLALGSLAPCADAFELRATPSPPADRAASIAAVQLEIARAKALSDAGHAKQSLELAKAVSAKSAELGFAPLTAKALYRLGEVQVEVRDGEAASETLRRAANAADAARDDLTRVQALTRHLFVEGYMLRRGDRIAELDDAIAAGLARIGRDAPELEGARRHSLGMALIAKGSLAEAAAALTEAVKLRERAHGVKSREVAMSRNGLCFVAAKRSDYETAIDECRRATELWTELLGPNHPELAFGLNNLGNVLAESGQYDEASTRFEATLAITEATFGPDNPRVAISLNNLGDALSKAGRHERAIAALERAATIREKLSDRAEPPREFILTSLGQAYLRSGDAARALETFERAQKSESPRTSPEDHAEIALGLASALWEQGDARSRTSAHEIAARAKTTVPADADVHRRLAAWVTAHR